jgi:hypothetical protein
VTAYFNPCDYATKATNLRRFTESVRAQGLQLLIVELAGGSQPFAVTDDLADRILRVRSDAVLWHKERLLNLALRELPAECDKVSWLDADVEFENADWVAQTCDLLDRYVVVQPFSTACWLRRGEDSAPPEAFSPGVGEGRWLHSIAYTMARKSDPLKALGNYFAHGHTGFAWAARRELLEQHGFYDRLILGGGDVAMARALFSPEAVDDALYSPRLAADLDVWRRALYRDVRGSVGCVGGRVVHRWHGNAAARRYQDRLAILRAFAFDPRADVVEDSNGCLAWASDKPELRRLTQAYFNERNEDG